MSAKGLDQEFNEAVQKASQMTKASLAPDVQLRLYAYYKQATSGTANPNYNSGRDLRNAFKINAWMQIRHLSIEEAKQLYIETINSIIENK